MKTPLLVTLFAFLSSGCLVGPAQAQSRRDDVNYTRGMPNGCTGVVQTTPGRFVLQECTLNGTVRVKPVVTRVIGRGIVQLTFPASHANYSDYYCSSLAPGLPTYSRDHYECTASGWRLSR